MTLLYALGGLLVGLVAVGFAFNSLHKPTRFLAVLLALSVATMGCGLRQKPKGVHAAETLQHALVALQTALRDLCDPSRPGVPLRLCTADAAKLGLTSVKARTAQASLTQAQDVLEHQLIPALKCAPSCVGLPAPKVAYASLYGYISDAVSLIRTLTTNPKVLAVLDIVQAITNALGALGNRVVRMPG